MHYYSNIQEIVRDIELNINVDSDEIRDNAMLLAQLDPNKLKREKNINMIKNIGQLAITLGAHAYTGPLADVAIISAYAFSQKFFHNTEAVESAFLKLLKKHDLTEKEKIYIEEAKQINQSCS